MKENKTGKQLSLREYIGCLLPGETKKESRDKSPLTLREYIGISPIPTLDDVANLFKGVRRFLK